MVTCYTAEAKKCSREKGTHEEFTKWVTGKENITGKGSSMLKRLVVKGSTEHWRGHWLLCSSSEEGWFEMSLER